MKGESIRKRASPNAPPFRPGSPNQSTFKSNKLDNIGRGIISDALVINLMCGSSIQELESLV